MNRLIWFFLLMFCMVSVNNAYAWSPFKGMIEAKVADEVNAVKNDVKGDINGINAKIAKLAEVNANLKAKIELQNNAIVGFNNQISQTKNEIKANNVSQTNNDTELMKTIIKAMSAAITGLIGLLGLFIRKYFTAQEKTAFYLIQFAAMTNPETIEKVMQKKKELEKSKSIISKAKDIFKKEKK